MALINPTPEEASSAMAQAVNSEKLRRELEAVFGDNAETIGELTDEELVAVVLDALHSAR